MHPTRRLRTTLIVASTIFTAATMFLLAPAAQAADGSDPGSASTLTTLTNQDRTGAGLAPLTVASDLVAVAVQHSQDMAAQGYSYHNPNLAQQGGSWQVIAENVGRGPSPTALNDGFMQSPSHRANIMNTSVTQIGIGIVSSGGVLYVTELFRLPSGSSAPAPAPAPAAAPAPPASTPPAQADDAPAATPVAAPAPTHVFVTPVAAPAPAAEPAPVVAPPAPVVPSGPVTTVSVRDELEWSRARPTLVAHRSAVVRTSHGVVSKGALLCALMALATVIVSVAGLALNQAFPAREVRTRLALP